MVLIIRSDKISRVPPYSLLPESLLFRLQDFHLLWFAFLMQFIYNKDFLLFVVMGSSAFARRY